MSSSPTFEFEDGSDEEFDDSKYEEEDYESLDPVEVLNVDEYSQLNEKDITEICLHKNVINDNGLESCADCGIEIYKELSLEPEWRFYGDSDSKHSSDPSRCHIRKVDEKNIFKDIEKYNFPFAIREGANIAYIEVTNGKIRRGNYRRAIIFACIFNAYKDQGCPQNPEVLREKFELTKKEVSKGLTYYNLNKKDKKKKPIYISPVSFIPPVMAKFNANDIHIEKVNDLYNKIHNRSKLLNRSNPQSVISGLVYYYFKLIGGNITSLNFSKMVKLSDITISRISKDISRILGTVDKVKLS